MFKDLLHTIILIISQPRKAWESLVDKRVKGDEFLSHFVYPLIGLLTLAAFLGVLFTRKEFDVEMALKASVRSLVAAFGGFFLSVYLMNEIWVGYFKREKDLHLWQHFVGYSSSLMFVLNAVLMLIPEFFFLRIFVLYTFYIIWEGSPVYMGVEDQDRLKFSSIATLIILVVPYVIQILLFMLMPGMRF